MNLTHSFTAEVKQLIPAQKDFQAVFRHTDYSDWFPIPLVFWALVEKDGKQDICGVVFWDGSFTLAHYENQFLGYIDPYDEDSGDDIWNDILEQVKKDETLPNSRINADKGNAPAPDNK